MHYQLLSQIYVGLAETGHVREPSLSPTILVIGKEDLKVIDYTTI
jgi:hypothetical protein